MGCYGQCFLHTQKNGFFQSIYSNISRYKLHSNSRTNTWESVLAPPNAQAIHIGEQQAPKAIHRVGFGGWFGVAFSKC